MTVNLIRYGPQSNAVLLAQWVDYMCTSYEHKCSIETIHVPLHHTCELSVSCHDTTHELNLYDDQRYTIYDVSDALRRYAFKN